MRYCQAVNDPESSPLYRLICAMWRLKDIIIARSSATANPVRIRTTSKINEDFLIQRYVYDLFSRCIDLFRCTAARVFNELAYLLTYLCTRLVSSRSENMSVSFGLRAPEYRLTLWCTLSLLVGGGAQYKCLSYSYSYNLRRQRQIVERYHISQCLRLLPKHS